MAPLATPGYAYAHSIEQQCGFGSALSPEESHITPGGNLPSVWEPLF